MTSSHLSLFYVRKEYFEWNNISEDEVIDWWDLWRKQDTYIVLQREEEIKSIGIDGTEFTDYKVVTKAIKCAKRGNDVYFFRVRNRLNQLLQICKSNQKLIWKDEDGYYTQFLYLTLTYDTKRCTVREAWEEIGKEWNRFLSYLKKKFGVISVIRTWESFENGYPHIHAVIYFFETAFRVIKYKRRRYTEWRLYDKKLKEEINKGWHSFVDIQAIENTKRLQYIFKYILKELKNNNREQQKQKRTLAMMWLFRKQSFSISNDFITELASYTHSNIVSDSERLDPIMHNSNWEFVGLFTAEELNIKDTNKFVIVFETIPNVVLKIV